MKKTARWFDSPAHNWIGTIVSVLMLLLYLQRLLEPGYPARTPWVTAAWALMAITWLGTAVYKTWLRDRDQSNV